MDGHAEKAAIGLFAGFRHVAEAARPGGIVGVDDLPVLGDAPDQPFPEPHAGLVHSFGIETLGGAEL